jgi:D-threo-aldose 1-dehydrogenase
MSDPRERVRLAASGVEVCRLGFGSAPLGGLLRETSESDALEAVRAALDAELFYFDTAPQYGGGLAERRLGAALRECPRERIVISSKVGKLVRLYPDQPPLTHGGFIGAPAHDIEYDYSYDGALRSLEASLARLGTDRLDIVFIHDVNRKYHGNAVMTRLEEALSGACRALRRLRDEGVIGAFGSALNEVDVSLRFVDEGDVDCIMLPQKFTLLDRSAEPLLLPKCLEQGISVLVAGPFDSGILATGAVVGATYNYQPASEAILTRVRAMERVCQDFDIPLRAAALQFPLRHPAVASVVTGMRLRAEVDENVAAMATSIPAEFWPALERARYGSMA